MKDLRLDQETVKARLTAYGNCRRALSDPNLTKEEREKWERIQRIVDGEPLDQIYPVEQAERETGTARICRLIGMK
jgi:hypothetical protein